ncbi:helix-turn-helix domain-containing protein [Paraburkholderia antibiotica]|uniref:Helix-turn-helix domain-containing protein n=1 Tax=Paraburkholderia antibiotica TaxID=2728839 RepID=A0A7X9X5I3_9BURK|nr:helix-turn-helix domain-containing protein [Paraburkholderia antibiotica]NML31815.1 helix-turn-helix domain-containing protein [Paraburkholderia antibiotica]
MKTTIEWLDAVKEALELPSDYAAASVLGVTRSAVSAYRNGKSTFDDETCIKVADILGVPRAAVLASMLAQRAKSEETRKVWIEVLEKFSKGFRKLALSANACGGLSPQA